MTKNTKPEETVKPQNDDVPRGRGRYRDRYRTLIGGFFDPDTDPDPDADKADVVLFTVSSNSMRSLELTNKVGRKET